MLILCRYETTVLFYQVVGDPEKPELKRHIDDLGQAWGNITGLYAKREQNLLDAMEKAMEFHQTLKEVLEFLTKSERRFDNLGNIASDIDQVRTYTVHFFINKKPPLQPLADLQVGKKVGKK